MCRTLTAAPLSWWDARPWWRPSHEVRTAPKHLWPRYATRLAARRLRAARVGSSAAPAARVATSISDCRASLTASAVGNACAISGRDSTRFVPSEGSRRRDEGCSARHSLRQCGSCAGPLRRMARMNAFSSESPRSPFDAVKGRLVGDLDNDNITPRLQGHTGDEIAESQHRARIAKKREGKRRRARAGPADEPARGRHRHGADLRRRRPPHPRAPLQAEGRYRADPSRQSVFPARAAASRTTAAIRGGGVRFHRCPATCR